MAENVYNKYRDDRTACIRFGCEFFTYFTLSSHVMWLKYYKMSFSFSTLKTRRRRTVALNTYAP